MEWVHRPEQKDLAISDLLDKAAREPDPVKRARLEALAESYWHADESKPALTIDFELPQKAATAPKFFFRFYAEHDGEPPSRRCDDQEEVIHTRQLIELARRGERSWIGDCIFLLGVPLPMVVVAFLLWRYMF